MRRSLVLLASLSALAGLCSATLARPALAAGLSAPVADCERHGQLTRSYSAAELKSALASIPADINEYSSCHDVINRALLAKLGKLNGSGSSGGGGSFLPAWLLVVVGLLVLGGIGFGVVALRNRSGGE
jgi:hypothetical protein